MATLNRYDNTITILILFDKSAMKTPGEFHALRWSGWNCIVSMKVEIDMNRTYSKSLRDVTQINTVLEK